MGDRSHLVFLLQGCLKAIDVVWACWLVETSGACADPPGCGANERARLKASASPALGSRPVCARENEAG